LIIVAIALIVFGPNKPEFQGLWPAMRDSERRLKKSKSFEAETRDLERSTTIQERSLRCRRDPTQSKPFQL
jgi:Sec-independent protein translocase protein TatA